jgi:hypothetical protein
VRKRPVNVESALAGLILHYSSFEIPDLNRKKSEKIGKYKHYQGQIMIFRFKLTTLVNGKNKCAGSLS